ncbi:MAG: Mbeg1-like protein [Candidatus Faecousia sp.]|nr:Mbeg1-like protein [Candidatus Faecousia sp.]
MASMLDYIAWRGDLSFSSSAPNEVDALIFSTLSYIPFRGSVERNPEKPVLLRQAAREFFDIPDPEGYIRTQNDLELLKAAGESQRFGNIRIAEYRKIFIKERDTQFAAVTFLLDDGSIFISFRGTDNTLVGWKEDFSMCFRREIPSQKLAKQYLQDVLMDHSGPVRVSGHSKGGNVAVYAVSQSVPVIRERILEVYNQDGPGFSEAFLEDPGYRQILPILHTQVPQSSVIGMILNRAEPIAIVKSNQSGIMQHDPFSWEVQGNRLVAVDSLSGNSIFLQLTIKNWLLGMDMETRVRMVDMLFDLLTSGDVEVTGDLFQPKNLVACVSRLRSSETIRKYLTEDLTGLFHAAKKARLQMGNRE